MKKYIFFDLDGTLTDSKSGIINAFNHCLSKFDIHKSAAEIETLIGPPLTDTFTNYFHFDEKRCNEAVAYFREYYDTKGYLENLVYDGIPELLADLKKSGRTVILATSKPERMALLILKHFDLYKYFDFFSGGMDDERFNKKSMIIQRAIERANLQNEDKSLMIMVGDRKNDLIGAMDNHMESAGILYGYGKRKEHEEYGATFILETVKDLRDFLLKSCS